MVGVGFGGAREPAKRNSLEQICQTGTEQEGEADQPGPEFQGLIGQPLPGRVDVPVARRQLRR